MALNDSLKIMAILLLAVAAAVFAYYFITLKESTLKLGNEVNMATFSSILMEAKNVVIVMDVRSFSNYSVNQNILQCGVDFAGSQGLAGKNLTFLSLDAGDSCIGISGNYSASYCFDEMNKGVTIYVKEGNATKFYTNAMVVGMGSNYSANGCNIGVKKQQ